MTVQIDDCIDVFKAVCPDLYVMFELDHSSGHLKSRVGGRNAEEANKSFGCLKNSIMDDTVLTNASCLGPFVPKMPDGRN